MLAEQRVEALLSCEDEALAKSLFLKDLHNFMDSKQLSIERIPQLGFKELDLFRLYKIVQKLGGFDLVTGQQMWKQVYVMLGADPRSTSAATSTRRHYEKLLLPYDLHLQEQKRAMTLPCSLKRPHHCSSSVQDEDSLRGSKRSTAYRLPNPTLTQRSPDIMRDCTVRIISKTRDNQVMGDPPSYHSLFPNILPPQTNNQPHMHPHAHAHFFQKLRSLALSAVIDRSKQIGSSSCVEPLDLSFRGNPIGRRLPSIAPPSDKKVPKFLNRVTSLYQGWGLCEEKEIRSLDNLPSGRNEKTQTEFESLHVQQEEIIEIIDLTTNNDIFLSSPPQTKNEPYRQPQVGSTCGPPGIDVNNTMEQKLPLHTGEGEGPFKLSRPILDVSTTATGPKQTVQQAGINERFGAPGGAMETGDVLKSQRKQWCQQGVMEPRTTRYGASQSVFPLCEQELRRSFRESAHWKGHLKGEESLNPVHWGSLCQRWQDRKVVPGHRGDIRWPYPHQTHSKALRPFYFGWLEAQELQVSRGYPSAQATPSAWRPPGPAMCRHEASHSSLRPSMELIEHIPGTTMGPSEVPKGSDVSPSPLIRPTPTEYWSL